jgi:zinc/manganese transport system ATP-binding protein
MRYGARVLFEHLDLDLEAGEFLAVLGPNGAGKTTLLRMLLGLTPPTSGLVEINGRPPRRGSHDVGYVPQQRAFDRDLPIRGRDLVRDEHDRGARRASTRVDQFTDRLLVREIERQQRLVAQQHLRIPDERLRDPQPLLLTA